MENIKELIDVTNALIFALTIDGRKDKANTELIKEAERIVKLCNLPVMRCACCGNTTKFSDGAKQQILIDEEYRYIYAVTCDECGKVCDVELFD